jgi:hypothetical protein
MIVPFNPAYCTVGPGLHGEESSADFSDLTDYLE